MVQITDGIGRYVLCEWCNHPLVMGSESNYTKCHNCGGKYNDPNVEKFIIKPVYNWYYYLWYFLKITLK